MSKSDRNLKVSTFIKNQLELARVPLKHKLDEKLVEAIDLIISCTALGFRGVVITSLAGKHIDKNFNPLVDFYGCNPRSIFEGPIRAILYESQIPCGKSDPLNVAKNIKQLNKVWAKGRRPEKVAMAVAYLLETMFSDKTTPAQFKQIQHYFFQQLLLQKREKILIKAAEKVLSNRLKTADLLSDFLIQHPEGGAIPQFFCGYLLKLANDQSATPYMVKGYDENVNATNTTAKKAGDIWEEDETGKIHRIFEVTVKKVDANRVEDCIQNLEVLNINDPNEVIFLCRIPEDTDSLHLKTNSLEVRNYLVQFLDIRKWFYFSFLTLRKESQAEFLKGVEGFMNELTRKQAVRDAWVELSLNL